MNKLTAEKCREFIAIFKSLEKEGHLALTSEYHLQAYEKALPILEQQERGEGEWIEWDGGECPVADHVKVEYQLRAGAKGSEPARRLDWQHEGKRHDIIAYRIIPERANKATLTDEKREWLIDECKADMQSYTSSSPRYLVAQIALASLEACSSSPDRATNQNGEQ